MFSREEDVRLDGPEDLEERRRPILIRIQHAQLKALDPIIKHDLKCYVVSMILLWIPLFVLVGLDLRDETYIEYTTSISFYLPEDTARQRLDAFNAARLGKSSSPD